MIRSKCQAEGLGASYVIFLGSIRPAQIAHVNVDTTVQTKDIRYPTDARLYDRARERLVKEARKAGLSVKQSYERVAGGWRR